MSLWGDCVVVNSGVETPENRSYEKYFYEFYRRGITAKNFYYSYIKKLESEMKVR